MVKIAQSEGVIPETYVDGQKGDVNCLYGGIKYCIKYSDVSGTRYWQVTTKGTSFAWPQRYAQDNDADVVIVGDDSNTTTSNDIE